MFSAGVLVINNLLKKMKMKMNFNSIVEKLPTSIDFPVNSFMSASIDYFASYLIKECIFRIVFDGEM